MEKNENMNRIIKLLEEDKLIDTLVEYAYILKMIREIGLNDEIIRNLGTLMNSILSLVPILEKFADLLNDPNVRQVIDVITSEEVVQIIQNPERMTVTKLLSEMRNENFQRGLGIIIKIIEKIGEKTKPESKRA
ncbi:DUF1641 domain-containing protein [Stygiolobus sp. CP850M]|uniref:DUF1641 domain-containing protein n=1 Tax=Stygiolobus sp. CP850M TaxID=3133134 RepID=UPI00307DC648